MSVLYCTVPDRVKYSTVIADEYRKVTEKIDYSTNQVLASCVGFFFFFFFFFFETKSHWGIRRIIFKVSKSLVVDSSDPDQTPQNRYTV